MDILAVATALVTLFTALTAFISVFLNYQNLKRLDTKVEEVHTEVKTANSLTLAQLADRVETRRIDKIPKEKQTAEEKIHVAEVPDIK